MVAATENSPSTPGSGLSEAVVRREVTVIIAAWRAAGTISKAVASALAQPETAEVVVVDDDSCDGEATVKAARAADDGSGRLTVLSLERNSGPARARNVAIRFSKAPWIAVLDSDDFMEPGRFAKLARLRGENIDILADDILQTPEGRPLSEGSPLWFSSDQTPIEVTLDLFFASCISTPKRKRREMGFLKPIMRRAFLEHHALAYDETMRLGEDFDLYSRALLAGARMRLVPWAGYVSVMRSGSLSLVHQRADLVALLASKDRLLASGKLSSAQVSLLKQVKATSKGRLVWVDFVGAIKSGDVMRAIWIMIKDPSQIPYVSRSVLDMVARKSRGGR